MLALLPLACSDDPPSQRHNTELTATVPREKPVIYIGVISRYNPVIMYKNYQPMMDYLSEHTPYLAELKLGKTYEDAVSFLGKGIVDIAILGGLTYLEAHKQYGAHPIVKPLNSAGEPFYHSVIIVRDDSPLMTIADLVGHSLALASFHSTAGNLIPRHELFRSGLQLHSLSRIENLPHYELVVKAVLKGRFDAGAVKDAIAHQYQVKGVRILHVSEPIPSGPLVGRANLPNSIRRDIATALLQLDASDPQHQAWMRAWDEELRHGFAPAQDADYDALRDILNRAPQGCGKGCHPQIHF